jgi:tRNA(Arg) A34 adenosine deaminase TadA
MTNEDYMKEAMSEADLSVTSGSYPFGCVVVDKVGKIVWQDHDRVEELQDPTAHGEVNAVRHLCKELQTLNLSEYIFYTTSEPCPTCLTTLVKARVQKMYYGAETESTASLPIKATYLASYAKKYPIEVIGGIMVHECLEQRDTFFKNHG